jgi:phage pi2 protein 07
LKPEDRQLVEKLQKYAELCQKKPENWSSKSTAQRTLKKLDNLWASLLLDVIMPRDKRK